MNAQLALVAIALLLTACGAKEDYAGNFNDRSTNADLYCSRDVNKNVQTDWYRGCIAGYMHDCSAAYCKGDK